ncbi:MAG: family 10 glycosylhydrolase [Synechococcaceae cyanobacterium]|nr:family 10 glycosylhydrolase [Synechococcaceae cyanobacterium]
MPLSPAAPPIPSAVAAATAAWWARSQQRWALSALAALALLGLAIRPPAATAREAPAAGSGLGVWLTTVDSPVMMEAGARARALGFLAANGFRRAALPVYSDGHAQIRLQDDPALLGLRRDPRLEATDPVADLVQGLRRRGMEAVAWFEFGLMAPQGAAWLQGRDELLLQDAGGGRIWQESAGLNRVWLNPVHPQVQDFLTSLVVQTCRRYRFDALQFDDHLGYPARFGYDPLTLQLWRQTPAGAQNPTPAPDAPDWVAWRAEQITALLRRIRGAMTSACPGVRLSVAPNPQPFSLANWLADWASWVRLGLVDEVVVQLYRNNLAAIDAELADPALREAATRLPVRIGLLAGLGTRPKALEQLQAERRLLAERGFAGVDLFFYETARQHFPAAAAVPPSGSP